MKSQYEKTRFWVKFMGIWIVLGIILGYFLEILIPYLIVGFFILIIICLIQANRFDKKLAKDDKKMHKKFAKNVKQVTKYYVLYKLSGFVVFVIYLLVLKFFSLDFTALRIILGLAIMILFYWFLNKKGLLGFASSDEKMKKS